MSVLIGVSALPQARYSRFSECLANLDKPFNSEVKYATGIDIGENRNSIIRHALASELEHQWVWFVDDDMVFDELHLDRLLQHRVPVVASLYLNRKPPHYAMAFNQTRVEDGRRGWKPVSLNGAPRQGLAEIVAAGTGGMLIQTDVFRAIEYDTWFDHHQSTDDLAFCQRVIEAGYPIRLDLSARMGHISEYEVWPVFSEHQVNPAWNAEVVFAPGQSIDVQLGD